MKMIVVDLDGTLLNQESKVSKKTNDYLKKIKEKGYIVVIATGRIYQSLLNVTGGAPFANFFVTGSGSCCYKENGESIFETTISKEIIKKIVNCVSDNAILYIDIGTKYKIYKYSTVICENNEYVKTIQDKNIFLNLDEEAFQMSLVFKENAFTLNMYEKLTKEFPKLEVTLMQDSFGSKKWIDILPLGCNKYTAIQKLAKDLNISNDAILAFGDGLNDVEMLKKCGKGVALKNALDEVKKVSDDVTEFSNNEDGVICYLKKYFNI